MAIDVNELNGLSGDAFRAILPQDIATQGYMKGVETFPDFIKKFDGAQKMIGSSERIPAADAPPEQWDTFFTKAGRPAKPTDYQLPKIDGIPEEYVKKAAEIGALREIMHQAGMNQIQANHFVKGFLTKMYQAEIAENKASEEAFNKTMDSVFGSDRQTVMEKGKQMLAQYIPDNVKGIFATLDDKALAVVLAATEGIVKKHVSEDGFRPPAGTGSGGGKQLTAADIQAQMKAIFAEPAYKDPFVDKIKHNQLVARMNELRAKAEKLV